MPPRKAPPRAATPDDAKPAASAASPPAAESAVPAPAPSVPGDAPPPAWAAPLDVTGVVGDAELEAKYAARREDIKERARVLAALDAGAWQCASFRAVFV